MYMFLRETQSVSKHNNPDKQHMMNFNMQSDVPLVIRPIELAV